MTDTTATHRCIDCPQKIEHTPEQLCPSCGRCPDHCQGDEPLVPGAIHPVGHWKMQRQGEAAT